MAVLLNKRGKPYQFLSGYRFEEDKRGFDILPDGTHGTSGFMRRAEMGKTLEYGSIDSLSGTVLGKLEDGRRGEIKGLRQAVYPAMYQAAGELSPGRSKGGCDTFLTEKVRREAGKERRLKGAS